MAKPTNWKTLSDGEKKAIVRRLGNDRITFLIEQAREITGIDASIMDKPRMIDTLQAAIGTLQMEEHLQNSNIEDMEMMLDYLELSIR